MESIIFSEPVEIPRPLKKSSQAFQKTTSNPSMSGTTLNGCSSAENSLLTSPVMESRNKGSYSSAFTATSDIDASHVTSLCESMQRTLADTKRQLVQVTRALSKAVESERSLQDRVIVLECQLRTSAEENVGVLRFYEEACRKARHAQERENRLLQENNQLRRHIESTLATEELTAMLEASQAQVIALQSRLAAEPDRAGFAKLLPAVQEQLCRLAEDNEVKHDRIILLEGELQRTRGDLQAARAHVPQMIVSEIDSTEVGVLSELDSNAVKSEVTRASSDRQIGRKADEHPTAPQDENHPAQMHSDSVSHKLVPLDTAVTTSAPPARPSTPMPQAKRIPLGTHKRLPRPAHARRSCSHSRRALPDKIPARIVATLS